MVASSVSLLGSLTHNSNRFHEPGAFIPQRSLSQLHRLVTLLVIPCGVRQPHGHRTGIAQIPEVKFKLARSNVSFRTF